MIKLCVYRICISSRKTLDQIWEQEICSCRQIISKMPSLLFCCCWLGFGMHRIRHGVLHMVGKHSTTYIHPQLSLLVGKGYILSQFFMMHMLYLRTIQEFFKTDCIYCSLCSCSAHCYLKIGLFLLFGVPFIPCYHGVKPFKQESRRGDFQLEPKLHEAGTKSFCQHCAPSA